MQRSAGIVIKYHLGWQGQMIFPRMAKHLEKTQAGTGQAERAESGAENAGVWFCVLEKVAPASESGQESLAESDQEGGRGTFKVGKFPFHGGRAILGQPGLSGHQSKAGAGRA